MNGSNINHLLLETQVETFNRRYKPGERIVLLTRSGLVPVQVAAPAIIQNNEVVAWFGNINNPIPVYNVICHQ